MPVGRLLSLAVVVFVSIAPAWAQPRYGEVIGKIVDASQGGVSDASVTVMDEDTGFRHTTQSETGGAYVVGSLAPGSYKITVRKEGFRQMVMFGVKVSAGGAARQDFQLAVGPEYESVTVFGTAPERERPDASTGGQFDLDQVGQLPLNARGVITLLELIPGTNVVPATRGDAGQFTTSGMRPNTNLFTVDGVSANTGVSAGGLPAQSSGGALPALSAFGSLDSMISVEAVQEFKLLTSTAVAEFGRMPGASIALSSRAGSDHFHGSAIFRFRSEGLGANDWFANQASLPRAPLGYEDLAPSLGGPLKRNRTFFFLTFERIWLNQPYEYKIPVPSSDVRLAVSPSERAVLNLFPQPTESLTAVNTGLWTGQINRPAGLTSGSVRIDQAVTQRVTFFGRYSDSPSYNDFGIPQVNHLNLRAQSLTLGLNARPTARTVLDLRVNQSQSTADSIWSDSTGSNAPGCALAQLASGFFPTKPITCDDLVRFSINGVGQVTSGREGSRRERQFQIVPTAGLNLGRHAIKLGVDYRRILAVRRDPTGGTNLIDESADTLTLLQNWWSSYAPPVNADAAVQELSLWLQDTWQVGSRLTVAGGLRWEFSPAPNVANANFLDPINNSLVVKTQPLWPTSYRDFAPRLGLALRLTQDGRTVLRAGGGIYYDSSMSIATDLINGGPFSASMLTSNISPFSKSSLQFGFEPGLKLPEVRQWNVALERSFGTHDVLSVGYVGSSGRDLIRREAGGAGTNGQNYVALTTDHGTSDYNALQAQYRRQVARGLNAVASYSWSHSLDNDSSDAFLLWSANGAAIGGDHASSDFDLRHSLTAALSYELPPTSSKRFGRRLLAGWALDGIVHARTGFPITLQQEEEINAIGIVNAYRPNWVYGQPLWITDSNAPGGKRLNPAAFSVPGTFNSRQGNLGRNVPSGFGMEQVDLSLKREFHFGEQRGLQFRVEVFNALNQANFADPVRFLDSPFFGQSTSMLNSMLGTGSSGSGLSPVLQIGGPRSVQFSVRVHF
jgi:Carboxypeptidase regulatory-like domain/TonB-dependent Receptor Plug Domain